jgi:hypothetical protein
VTLADISSYHVQRQHRHFVLSDRIRAVGVAPVIVAFATATTWLATTTQRVTAAAATSNSLSLK